MPKSRAFSLCFALLTSSCFTAGYASGPLVNGKISKNANDDVLIKESLVDEKVTKDGAPPRKEEDWMIDTDSNDVPLMSSNGNSAKEKPLRSNEDTSGKQLTLKPKNVNRAKVVSLRSSADNSDDERVNIKHKALRRQRYKKKSRSRAHFIHVDINGILVAALSFIFSSIIKEF
ncbi:hypothetical protein EGW08_008626 [Elysia chlorotica]|uniref:Uncharacterized protein n=1 Tax=Elysia chlorotica TaxID=188477 RepID=A0A433TPX3_ELYCH|nr:hypothetical protein EGW08_008626 [Elysia chlorotica]